MKFFFTNDPILGRSHKDPSKYQAIFDGLTPANPCVVFDDFKDAMNFRHRLEVWVERHHKGAQVRSTRAYKTDGMPRVWLVFPETVRTAIRGRFLKGST